jgi:uncharacterized membrane protein
VSVLLFMAAALVTLEKSAKGGMQKFFKYVPAVVLCYLIAMLLCTLGVWDMAETKPITFQSLILLLGSVFLVSAIATNVGNKLYALTNFSDKATWTVLFVTVVALIAVVTPLGKVAGSGEVSSLLLYAVIGLLASRASLLELGEAPAWIATGFIVLGIHAVLMLIICKLLKLDLFTAGVASLANIGGTASAPVLAGSYSGSLVPVGILMALMGYVVGTPLAVVCAHIMESLA